MSAVIEFGFDSAAVFSGVDRLDRRLRKMDSDVTAAQAKVADALRNPWVSAGINVQAYTAKIAAASKEARVLAAAQAGMAAQQAKAANYRAVNPWTGQSAESLDQRKAAAAAMAAQQAASDAAAARSQQVAALWQATQRKNSETAMAAHAAQQKAAQAAAAIQAAAQSKAVAAAAAAATVAAAEQRSASLKTNNGRLHLALLESQISGNKKEAASIQSRISLMERMRTIQAQTNVSQREAYQLAQRSAGLAAMGGARGRNFAVGMGAMQMQDVAVQMQMGTRMSTIIAQQGSQLLSIFGTGGMLLGGLVAVAGMFYTMQSKAAEALQGLNDEVRDFDGNLQKLKGGSLTDMLNGMDAMAARADEARAAIGQFSVNRFFAKTTYDEQGNASNAFDAANEAVATTNDQGRLDLEKQIVIAAEKQAELARLRLDSRDAEARKMERAIELAQIWQQIDQRKWASPEAKEAYTKSVESKLAAEQQQDDKTVADQKKAEMQAIAAAQQRLDEQKKDAALDQMTLAQRIAIMSVDAQKALAEENRLKGAAKLDAMAIIDAESRRVGIQQQILQSQRQLATEKEREAEATKRAAEQAAADNATRKAAVLDTMQEYKLLQAKAAGRTREVEQIERQSRILDRAARLEQQNGLAKRDAMALAMRMVDLEDRADGKRRKIRAPTDAISDPEQRYGLSGRQSRTMSRVTGPLAKGGPLTKGGGLSGFWNLQMGNIGQLGTGPSDHMNRNTFSTSPSLMATHAENAAKQSAPTSGGTGAVVSELQKLIALSERGFFGS
jgi:hypothetical protein